MHLLSKKHIYFPHPLSSESDGPLAIGGDLSIERLILAYNYGFFPWYNPYEPIIWWHPDPRFVILPHEINVSKSMRSYFNKEKFTLKIDTAFHTMIEGCKTVFRKGQPGTWITDDIENAYGDLYDMGIAHSIEVWQDDMLVGGLYGLGIGKVFFGESMFSAVSNASKFALIALAKILEQEGYWLIDCQMPNKHLKSMGGRYLTREAFFSTMKDNMKEKNHFGKWTYLADKYPTHSILNLQS